jgi:nucleotide-binding universal stress UspA family protein
MSHDVLLVAVDDTESSDRAFEFAANYADRLGAELHLIHVVRRQLNMSA